MRRTLIALLLGAAYVLAPAATAATPPGLGGMQLTASSTTILSCNVGDFGGSFTYATTGTATGAYAGTFTETGTVAVGPLDARNRHPVTALNGTFAIDSPAGAVSGTHQFTAPSSGNAATADCLDGWSGPSASLFAYQNALRYTAAIKTADGAECTAAGPALIGFTQGSSVIRDSFAESFYNDVAAPAPVCEQADETPPTLVVPEPVVADATGPDGAAVTYEVSATDDVDAAPVVACAPASGSMFPIGPTVVACTATDAAGNVAEASFAVTVRGAAEQIEAGLDADFPGLRAKQAAALADVLDGRIGAACGVLGAYANQVDALEGGRLDPALAASLLAAVARVQAVLGC